MKSWQWPFVSTSAVSVGFEVCQRTIEPEQFDKATVPLKFGSLGETA
jgi:hypothetical protein